MIQFNKLLQHDESYASASVIITSNSSGSVTLLSGLHLSLAGGVKVPQFYFFIVLLLTSSSSLSTQHCLLFPRTTVLTSDHCTGAYSHSPQSLFLSEISTKIGHFLTEIFRRIKHFFRKLSKISFNFMSGSMY